MATQWNPSDSHADLTFSNGDLTVSLTNDVNYNSGQILLARATNGANLGKWYFEVYVNNFEEHALSYIQVSLTPIVFATRFIDSSRWPESNNCVVVDNTGYTAFLDVWTDLSGTIGTVSTGSTIQVAVDFDNGNYWFGINNVWFGNPATNTSPAQSISVEYFNNPLYPTITIYGLNENSLTGRFNNNDFAYTPPAGFSAWDGITKNNIKPQVSARWDLISSSEDIELSNNYLTATPKINGKRNVKATPSHSSGKWYFEVYVGPEGLPSSGYYYEIGLVDSEIPLYNKYLEESEFSLCFDSSTWVYAFNYSIDKDLGIPGVNNATFTTENTVLQVAVDLDAKKVWFGVNNAWTGDPALGTDQILDIPPGVITYYPGLHFYTAYNQDGLTANFLNTDLIYAAPAGFSAWGEVISPNETLSQRWANYLLPYLLQSATLSKPASLYFALLTANDPITESSAVGYTRCAYACIDSNWSTNFFNQRAIQFPPFTDTITGYAIFIVEPTITVTLNPIDCSTNIALSNSNLTATNTSLDTLSKMICRATEGKSSGAWYFEVFINSAIRSGANPQFGLSQSTLALDGSWIESGSGFCLSVDGWVYGFNDYYLDLNSVFSYELIGTGKTVRVAIDFDTREVWFGLDNVWSGNPETHSNPAVSIPIEYIDPYFPTVLFHRANNDSVTFRFNADDLIYSTPDGFLPWESSIDKLLIARSFATPVECVVTQPGLYFPKNELSLLIS